MSKKLIIASLSVLSLSCSTPPKENKITDHFKDLKGCFLLYDLKAQKFQKIIGEANCKERLPACSTFKVPLSVMAFDSGVLKDEHQVLKWDGVKDVREEVNRDHNAQTWMRDSVVWFSQRLTPKMGEKKVKKYLSLFNYGNQDLSQGLRTAWLTSPSLKDEGLRISAYEQVEFMKNLWKEKFEVSKRSMELTKKITYLETSPHGYVLNGKTGSNFYDKERKYQLGWFISHVEKGDSEFIAVTLISDQKAFEGQGYGGPRAKQITKDLLAEEGLW